ncbi:MAG: CHASE domain-containing protein [Melioribacteraceae bacterium]|nr:CHASE domain-containing protein [Melioribacteraceae bacterium]MCF8396393.1 CHASE domain-containing protein [Melioribacteraceae bacterium]
MVSSKVKRKKKRAGRLTSRLLNKITSNRYILPSLVLAAFLIITYFNWDFADTSRKNELQLYFEHRAEDVYEHIEHRVIGYKQILKGTLGLFNANGGVNRAEFRSFFKSQDIDETYPGIQGVGFSLIIPPDQIKKHITAIHKEGFPGYKLWPEGIRETYTTIIYLEPFNDRNLRAFGYDMFSEPVRRKAMEAARDSNEAVITGRVDLVQETGSETQAGFLIYLPVYKKGAPHATLLDRRKNIIGWVYSPFRMGDFMEGIFGERSEDLEIEIYYGKNLSDETKMYSTKTQNTIANYPFTIEKAIDFDGHEWRVLINYTPQLKSRLGINSANVILIVGFCLTILLTMITYLLINKRIITIRTAEERKAAEVLLNKLREDQKILLDNIPASVVYKDTENRFIRVNKTFADIMEMSAEQLEGKNLREIFPEEQAEAFWKDDLEVIKSGTSKNKIIELMHSPKGNIWVQTDKIPYRDEQGKIIGLIGFALDITEHKYAEDELKKSYEQVTKLNAEKDKFFSIIAHDLRSPFNGFIGLTGLMADNSENFSADEFVEHSKSINNSAKRLYKLLEYLLEWAQIQNGAIEFTPKNLELAKLVTESIDTIYERAKQKSIEITNEIESSQKVYADERMIGAVLRNLLSNAVKFTNANGKISIKTGHTNNGTVKISIEDNGVGIPEEDIGKLFKVEEKVSTAGTDGETSIGLGLLLCKEFIDMHGGKIWAESEEGKGSKFYFIIPT